MERLREKDSKHFNRIERFFRLLEIFTGITPTTAMRDIIIEIMAEMLTILAIATKEVKEGRLSKSIVQIYHSWFTPCLKRILKKLTGNTDIEDSLERLDKLILEGARMASTELVKMTRNIDGSAMGVDGGVKGASGRLQDVRGDVHDIGNLVQGVEARGQDLHGDVQDVGHKVEKTGNNILSRVQRVDHILDQFSRSSSL